eukprot:Mycagemm_TRINITY_DN10298_c1_g1::TRINITY_DN10298_c1_g1_i1::g.4209::m.4209 type:complete len:135 gc:universal TRINITY_DN10298_c1_g1_i1:875-471(-)
MISAEKMRTLHFSASRAASSVILTSKARITACSGLRSSITEALMTSFLWMGPSATDDTGMSESLRNSSSASSEPSVEACTYTPRPPLLLLSLVTFSRSFITSFMADSLSSGRRTTYSCEPATACSRSGAAILIP